MKKFFMRHCYADVTAVLTLAMTVILIEANLIPTSAFFTVLREGGLPACRNFSTHHTSILKNPV